MRYYEIIAGETKWTTWVNGQTDPGALQVDLEMPLSAFDAPISNFSVRVWGVSLQTISSASDFNGKPISIAVGMKPGLPLATAAPPAGVVFQGSILQAFGNWVQTEQYLEFVVTTNLNVTDANNIVLDGKKGQSLEDAVKQALTSCAPALTVDIKIDPRLILVADDPATFPDLFSFANHVKNLSQTIIGGDYPGVSIFLDSTAFKVFDGSADTNPKSINFYDMIGQPTWYGPAQMQFNCVMRADLTVGDIIKMPDGLYVLTAAAQTQALRYKSAFNGTFRINALRHVGNSRQPNAESWITSYFCSPTSTNPVFANG